MKYLPISILIPLLLFQKSFGQEKNPALFNTHRFYIEYKLGLGINFNDARTRTYLNQYLNFGFGAAVYLKNLKIAYTFSPVSIRKVKKDLDAIDGYRIKPYDRGTWNTKSQYWINFLRHELSLGYELKLSENCSLTPALGFVITDLRVINDSIHAWKYSADIFYGASIGFSARKYFFVSNDVRFFMGLDNTLFLLNMNHRFSGLGNSIYLISVNCGFKFRPTGKGLELLFQALIRNRS